MQFLFLHIAWHLLLRYRAARILIGAFALLCLIPMLVSMSGAREVRQSETVQISGPFLAAGPDDLGRLNIRLANFPYRFVVHADAHRVFPQAAFLQGVRPGDALHLIVRRQDMAQAVTRPDNLVVFFGLRSDRQTFLTFAASQAIIAHNAHHQHPFYAALLLVLLAVCLLADLSARFRPRPAPPATPAPKPNKNTPWYGQN